MYKIGYICTILNCIVFSAGRFQRSKKGILAFEFIAKALSVTSFFMFGSLTSGLSDIWSFVVLTTANIKERKNISSKVSNWLFIAYEAVYVLILAFTFNGISSLLIFTVSTISIVSLWYLQPQNMRVAEIMNSFIYLALQFSIGNFAGITEFVVIGCNTASYCKYEKEEKRNELRQELLKQPRKKLITKPTTA
ncbi:MAG: YgjV family protein [Ruminococcus sp.]|nr:YgjV family protein [Ruminococcus sp.]